MTMVSTQDFIQPARVLLSGATEATDPAGNRISKRNQKDTGQDIRN